MRNFTLLSLMVFVFCASGNFALAQSNMDFETAATGQGWSWESVGSATFAEVANPSVAGINTSAKCGKLTIPTSAPDYALGWFFTSNLMPVGTPFVLTANKCHIKLMVYSSVINPFIIKLEAANAVNGASPDNLELSVSNTKINQWEELNFDFTSILNGKEQIKMVLLPVWGLTRTKEEIVYWDNLRFTNGSATALSTTKAEGITLYPNPTTGVVNFTAAQEIETVVVSNIVGEIVKTLKVTATSGAVDLTELANGTYIVSIQLANGTIATQKLIKK